MPKKTEQKSRPDLDDQRWIVWLSQQPENRGIEVQTMYRKMFEWCDKKGVTPTRRRLLNWLTTEREAMPLTYVPPTGSGVSSPHVSKGKTPDEPPLPDCSICSNERFVSEITNPDAKFDFLRSTMVPCTCNPNRAAILSAAE